MKAEKKYYLLECGKCKEGQVLITAIDNPIKTRLISAPCTNCGYSYGLNEARDLRQYTLQQPPQSETNTKKE